jgi:RNA 2',3'-cyclic 3'-phosphodiesterase
MPRCFVAIPLPEEVKDCLVAVQPHTVPGVRMVRRDKMHLTLHFLGDIEDRAVEKIKAAFSVLEFGAITIDIRGLGRFPPRGRANVLWAGIEGNPALAALHKSLGIALKAAIRFRPEKRPFAPHLTLARLNPSVPIETVEQYLREHADFQFPSVLLDRFVLYSSLLTNAGSEYQEEAEFPLLKDEGGRMRDEG